VVDSSKEMGHRNSEYLGTGDGSLKGSCEQSDREYGPSCVVAKGALMSSVWEPRLEEVGEEEFHHGGYSL